MSETIRITHTNPTVPESELVIAILNLPGIFDFGIEISPAREPGQLDVQVPKAARAQVIALLGQINGITVEDN